MKYNVPQKGIVYLQDGTVFEGFVAGKIGTCTGEICFNTAMTGYQETFTDPSYLGQILVMNTAHIGNYGVHAEEVESGGIKIAGMICRNLSDKYSRKAAIDSVQAYFENAGVTVVYGIDTRALVRHIRSCGAMNAIISGEVFDTAELQKIMAAIPSMEGLELSSKVSVQQAYETGPETAEKKVALLDLGVKENIIRCLTERDVRVKVFPMNTPLAEMQAWNPDGYLISNGPGDPETLTGITQLLKDMIAADLKIFGICLGHQVLGQALGMETFKMFNGHRGINHPILNHLTGKGEITTQNHGFAIKKENIPDHVEITHSHLNDGTVAGIRIKNKPVFSVQYHPEASAGPHDSRYLFDEFVASL